MPSLSDFVNDITPRERAEVDKALMKGENVLWAVRPQPRLWCAESILMFASALPGLVFLGFWTHGLLGFPESWEEVSLNEPMLPIGLLFSLPVYGTIIYFLCFPWLRLRKLQRSLCVLTNQRALVLEPGLCSLKMRSWGLMKDMVLERHSHADGRGDLIFSIERHRSSKGSSTTRRGFRELPNLQEAEQRLAAALTPHPGAE